jgi:hypothetical protein
VIPHTGLASDRVSGDVQHGVQHNMPRPQLAKGGDGKRKFTSTAITTFFTPPPKRGQPPSSLPMKKRGRPPALPAATETPPSAPAVAGSTSGQYSEPVVRKEACEPAKKRVRHGQSTATLEHLKNTVNNWLNKTGEFLSEDPALPIKDYCALVNISWETFRKYVCSDVGKRRCIGAVAGNRAILPESTSQFAVDVMRRRDRGNDAMTKREVVDLLQDLAPRICIANSANRPSTAMSGRSMPTSSRALSRRRRAP